MKTTKRQFAETLHHEIPLTRTMGIEVVEYDEHSLCLSAPLSINANHKDTFFGGSLYTVAVTTGWGLVYLKMKELGYSGHVVINEANIKYQLPVEGDVLSYCQLSEQQLNSLEKQLRRRSKAVLSVEVVLGENKNTPQVVFSGRYAIV